MCPSNLHLGRHCCQRRRTTGPKYQIAMYNEEGDAEAMTMRGEKTEMNVGQFERSGEDMCPEREAGKGREVEDWE